MSRYALIEHENTYVAKHRKMGGGGEGNKNNKLPLHYLLL